MATSFENEYYNEPENCGVEFNSSCGNVRDPADNLYLEEQFGECGEEDEGCISRQKKQPSGVFTVGKGIGSKNLKVPGLDEDGDNVSREVLFRQSKITTQSRPMQRTSKQYFEDLPSKFFEKKFEPDYPADLQMKQICTAKPIRRRTLGITRTQPKAVFVPSCTTIDNRIVEKNQAAALSASKTGKKSVALSSFRTSAPIWEAAQGFSMDQDSPLEQNRLPPPVECSSDEVIVDWLEDHNIQMMFEYFLGLCVINQPENPWAFISVICSKMIEARTDLTAFDRLPRVLTPEHTEAIFRIYDRIENGFITVPQYKSAMDAMGLNRFSTNPKGWDNNAISRDTFIKEATEAIDDLLRTFMMFEQQQVTEEKFESTVNLGKTFVQKTDKKKLSLSGSGSYSGSSSYSRSGSGSDEKSPEGTAYEKVQEEEEEEEEIGLDENEEYEIKDDEIGGENEAYENEDYFEEENDAEQAPTD